MTERKRAPLSDAERQRNRRKRLSKAGRVRLPERFVPATEYERVLAFIDRVNEEHADGKP